MPSSTRRSSVRRAVALLALALVVALAVVATTVAGDFGRGALGAAPDNSKLYLVSTTSVRDSGLMDNVVIPAYNAAHPDVTVVPTYTGSGGAITAARNGTADVIIVHSPADEKQLLADGYATLRLPFAYNYFTVVGPRNDPANVATATSAAQAFKRIAAWGAKLPAGRTAFVSRGDASGTNKKELALWYAAKVTTDAAQSPTGAWYLTANTGMLATLQITAEKKAYTLTDTATWLANRKTLIPDLYRKLTKKADLKNQYSVILLNQAKDASHEQVASANAELLAAYLVSYEGQQALAAYGKDTYGEPLFFPNAYTISKKF